MDISNIALATEDFEAKVKSLKLRLKSRMNGKTTEQMTNGQVVYSLNYGIAIHHIKELAEESNYTYDECNRLWKLNIREAMLIAAMCVKDEDATSTNLAPWIEQIATPDMAEQSAFFLFKRVSDIDAFIETVVNSKYEYGRCVAFFVAARAMQSKRQIDPNTISRLLNDIISNATLTIAEARGASMLLRQMIIGGVYIEQIKEFVAKCSTSGEPAMLQLAYEVQGELELQ